MEWTLSNEFLVLHEWGCEIPTISKYAIGQLNKSDHAHNSSSLKPILIAEVVRFRRSDIQNHG
jgi:hypothetical protein